MTQPARRLTTHALRGRGQETTATRALFLAVMAVSVYLLQQPSIELASVVSRPWPGGVRYRPDEQIPSYLALTVAWPLVLATLCWMCRRSIGRKRVPVSFEATERSDAGGTRDGVLRGEAFAGRRNRGLWNAFAAGPGVAVGLHLALGFLNIAALAGLGLAPRMGRGTWWVEPWARLALPALAGTGAAGLWGALLFFTAMKDLRDAVGREGHRRAG